MSYGCLQDLADGTDDMIRKFPLERMGNALVKQHAYPIAAVPALKPG